MTTATIHPIVLEKLQRFRRQRRRLILWRGFCATLAVWQGAMIAVALLDRLVVLPDGLRFGMSLAADVATVVVFWFVCGRNLVRRPDERELARLMELAAPQLHEKLLSAVELAESDDRWDSAEFRAALQQATARDVGNLEIEQLLTGKLIAGWFYATGVVGAILLLLLLVPGLHFTQSLARVVLPGANLARYSRVQIAVLAPAPPDQITPEGDAVPVTVEVTGGDGRDVVLETIQPTECIPMFPGTYQQFTAAIQVNQVPVQFRIRAGDALTRRYTLTPRPRPHVVRFQKTYEYPVYSRLSARTVTEENGNLDALEGTTVELNLEVDQPIKEAELRFATKQELPLARDATGHLLARVPLTASGVYQVHLVAAETDFENKFSPQYEIRVRPDQLPVVKIDHPDNDQVLPPDAVVDLAGTANDDLGVVNVIQAVQVNREEWQEFPVAMTGTAEVHVARAWNLTELGVQSGDYILTKLVATDLKGQRSESAPLRLRIATPGSDPDRLQKLQERQALNQSVQELRELADQLDTKAREARTAANPLAQQQAHLVATTTAAATERKADDVLRQIKNLLPRADSVRDSADLVNLGSAVSRLKHQGLTAVRAGLENTTTPLAPVRPLLQDQAGTAAESVAKRASEPLQDRAALEELRPHSDGPYVKALSQTADALAVQPDIAVVKALEQAVRQLESGHALEDQAAALRQLSAQERWEQPASHADRKWTEEQLHRLLPRTDLTQSLAKIAAAVDQARQQLQPALEQARAEIAKHALALSDLLADVNRVEEAKVALRRDANAQNLATEEGRERARDADDATAILRQNPTPADHIQLAEHYRNLEAGHPEPTRSRLRETEKERGLKPALDAEYAKAQALENLASLPPDQQLAELERALQDNPPLRLALSEIAQRALQTAANNLQKAAAEEGQIAGQPDAKESALAQQPGIEQAVRAAGKNVERAGRHESRLGQEKSGQALQQLGQKVANQTGAEVAKAAAAMAQATSPAEVSAAAQTAQQAIQASQNAVSSARPQSPVSAGTLESSSQLAAVSGEAAKWLARALDDLDATQNSSTAPAMAAQTQAASMRNARGTVAPAGTGKGGGGGTASGAGVLPEIQPAGGNWGKLPPKLARDLLDSQRESVGGEYREMVETYFRAIAEKAREKQP